MLKTKIYRHEFNGETGENVEIEMSEEEIAELNKSVELYEEAKKINNAFRESALLKLAELGLTTEEIAAL